MKVKERSADFPDTMWSIHLLNEQLQGQAVADPGFWIRGVNFNKFRPKPPIFCNVTVGLDFT